MFGRHQLTIRVHIEQKCDPPTCSPTGRRQHKPTKQAEVKWRQAEPPRAKKDERGRHKRLPVSQRKCSETFTGNWDYWRRRREMSVGMMNERTEKTDERGRLRSVWRIFLMLYVPIYLQLMWLCLQCVVAGPWTAPPEGRRGDLNHPLHRRSGGPWLGRHLARSPNQRWDNLTT